MAWMTAFIVYSSVPVYVGTLRKERNKGFYKHTQKIQLLADSGYIQRDFFQTTGQV